MMSAVPDDIYNRLRDVEDESLSNTLKLAGHERECAIRYTHINESVTGIQKDIRHAVAVCGSLLLATLAFLVKLVFFAA